jgi:hypothetical protein
MRFFDLSAMLRPPKVTVPAVMPAAAGSIRLALESQSEDAKPRTLISVLGELSPNVGEMLESVALACRVTGEFPVAIMSELRPELISVATMPIEFLPTRDYLPVEAHEYDRHVRRRWSLIIGKWEASKQIELGLGFEAFLAAELRKPSVSSCRADAIVGYTLASEA